MDSIRLYMGEREMHSLIGMFYLSIVGEAIFRITALEEWELDIRENHHLTVRF